MILTMDNKVSNSESSESNETSYHEENAFCEQFCGKCQLKDTEINFVHSNTKSTNNEAKINGDKTVLITCGRKLLENENYSSEEQSSLSKDEAMLPSGDSGDRIKKTCEKCCEDSKFHLEFNAQCEHKCRMSKSEKKKRRYHNILQKRKLQRKEEKLRRKERIKQEIKEHENDGKTERLSKRQELDLIRTQLEEGLRVGQRICVDLSLESNMTFKEKSKLAQQLCRLYGVNRKSKMPAHLYFAGLEKNGELYQECLRKNSGFLEYKIEMTEKLVTELFPLNDIVYLTPDGDEELSELGNDKVYVIGGLVDESIKKNITKQKASSSSLSTARLPIEKYMRKVEQASHSQVLAINQVFEILMQYKSTGDWTKALTAGVPLRKGYVLHQE